MLAILPKPLETIWCREVDRATECSMSGMTRNQCIRRGLAVIWTVGAALGLYALYRVADPLPPRRLVIAAGIADTTYDAFAHRYARILARNGIDLQIRNYSGVLEHFEALRRRESGVQAAFATFGLENSTDSGLINSLGGITDTPLFILYRGAERIDHLMQLRTKRLSIGMPGTTVRTLLLEVLQLTGAMDASTPLVDLGFAESIDALSAGRIDVAMLPMRLDDPLLRRALGDPSIRMMNVAQAEAISKNVSGLRHVVLPRGIIDLKRDVPAAEVNSLAFRNRVLVRTDLHPALQYLLLQAMREVHSAEGPLNRIGEFPVEQPNDLPLSPTARAFYGEGPSFWQRYTSFWFTSLINRIVFFAIPFLVVLFPLLNLGPRLYKWMRMRPIRRLHERLGDVEREIARLEGSTSKDQYRVRIANIESAVRSLKYLRGFDTELNHLRSHVRLMREEVDRYRSADGSPGQG